MLSHSQYRRKIKNFLKFIHVKKEPEILELFFRDLDYSNILKKAFPICNITGFETSEDFVESNLNDIFSNYFTFDLIEQRKPEYNNFFDLVTIGSINKKELFSSNFKVYEEEQFKSILYNMDFYLKRTGEIVIFTCSDKYNSNPQKNFIKAQYFTQSLIDNTSITLLNEKKLRHIFEDTLKAKNYLVKYEYITIDSKLTDQIDCMKYIEENNMQLNEELLKKAKRIDSDSKKYGQEYGSFLVLRAKKN